MKKLIANLESFHPKAMVIHIQPLRLNLEILGKYLCILAALCGALDMLYDSLPKRIRDSRDFMELLNVGAVGDIKSQNVPRSTKYD